MLEVRGRLDLGEEPVGADHRRQFGAQHLERDLAIVLEVVGEVDKGHPARAEFANDGVSSGKGFNEPGER